MATHREISHSFTKNSQKQAFLHALSGFPVMESMQESVDISIVNIGFNDLRIFTVMSSVHWESPNRLDDRRQIISWILSDEFLAVFARRNKMALAKTSSHRKTGGRTAGFTLVEILIALVVIGVAAALVVPKFLAKPDPAKIETARQEVSAIRDALTSYHTDNNIYPTPDQGLAALSKKPTQTPIPPAWQDTGYLDKVPTDPWGNPYQYKNPGEHGDVDVFSLGADGKPGGEGADADIGSWM